ncbi:MAG: hypothetical protein V1772_12975 [Chloroflexota bacterium]
MPKSKFVDTVAVAGGCLGLLALGAAVVWVVFWGPWWLAALLGVGILIYGFLPTTHEQMASHAPGDTHMHGEMVVILIGMIVLGQGIVRAPAVAALLGSWNSVLRGLLGR